MKGYLGDFGHDEAIWGNGKMWELEKTSSVLDLLGFKWYRDIELE